MQTKTRKGPRTERLDIDASRYAEPHDIIQMAKAKIVSLRDIPIDVEIKGRKPLSRGMSRYFITAVVEARD